MHSGKVKRWIVVFLYFCAALQFVRYYSKTTVYYLNMPAYLNGHERLPFQERVLPIFFIGPMVHSRWVMEHLAHRNGAFTPERGAFYLFSLIALIVASLYTQKLYAVLSRSHSLDFLVFPVFLFATMWTYTVHNEANFSYPYDLLSLAFFTAGLYFVYLRQYWPLAAVIFFGTMNRETTLFLIGIYIIDAASVEGALPTTHLRDRFSLRKISWSHVGFLVALWCSVKLTLAHIFAHNDGSENYVRILENIGRLKIRLLPALLNICGYILPIVVVLRREIRPVRLANYLYILPLWFAIMFYTGVILETRIYGELCSFTAIAIVLIMEHRVEAHTLNRGPATHHTRTTLRPHARFSTRSKLVRAFSEDREIVAPHHLVED